VSAYDGRLISSFALFKTKQDNLAIYVAPDYYSAENGTTAQGVEFELNGELAEGWQFSTGYSYSVITDSNDKRINTVLPRHSLKTFTSYRLPGALENLTVGGGMNWQSKTGRDLGAYTQDSYALFNLMAKYEFDEHISGTMNINNLLNKEYIVGYGASSHGFFGEPRNLMVSLKYQY
jgi:outer-membrane receptor for ferric coprogen and ferric-rhodotorulic acid